MNAITTTISTTSQLVSHVIDRLGYRPDNSLVLTALNGNKLGLVVRVDLPAERRCVPRDEEPTEAGDREDFLCEAISMLTFDTRTDGLSLLVFSTVPPSRASALSFAQAAEEAAGYYGLSLHHASYVAGSRFWDLDLDGTGALPGNGGTWGGEILEEGGMPGSSAGRFSGSSDPLRGLREFPAGPFTEESPQAAWILAQVRNWQMKVSPAGPGGVRGNEGLPAAHRTLDLLEKALTHISQASHAGEWERADFTPLMWEWAAARGEARGPDREERLNSMEFLELMAAFRVRPLRDALLVAMAVGGQPVDVGELMMGRGSQEPDWRRVEASKSLLRRLVCSAPNSWRAPYLTCLGWLEWLGGKGSTGRHHVDAALKLEPGYSLASLCGALMKLQPLSSWGLK